MIAPFLTMYDQFEITLVFYKYKEQESEFANSLPYKRIYWSDFYSPYQILNEIQPDLVILFGFGNIDLSLIISARNKNIPTCFLAHGLHGNIRDVLYKSINKKEDNTLDRFNENSIYYKKDKLKTFLFALNSLRIYNVKLLPLFFKRLWLKYKNLPEEHILIKTPLKYFNPDYYILFAPAHSERFIERDKIHYNQLLYTGPYTMDKHFSEINKLVSNKPVNSNKWLFIDQPLIYINKAKVISFYFKMGEEARINGKQLIIKLHPLNYVNDWMPSHPSISYIKDTTTIAELVNQAELCFGFYSALLLPIICKRKCLLFNPSNNNITNSWAKLGVIKIIDFNQPKVDLVELDKWNIDSKLKNTFINKHIFDDSGHCTIRLEQIIIDISKT